MKGVFFCYSWKLGGTFLLSLTQIFFIVRWQCYIVIWGSPRLCSLRNCSNEIGMEYIHPWIWADITSMPMTEGCWCNDLGVASIGMQQTLSRCCITRLGWKECWVPCPASCLKGWLVHYFHHRFCLDWLSPICCSAEVSRMLQDDNTFECSVLTEK